MSAVLYGGDEVGALVFDFGQHSLRAGFAGEEFPKCDLPSWVGVIAGVSDSERRVHIGTESLCVPRAHAEAINIMAGSRIDRFDLLESVLDHIYTQRLYCSSAEHPALFSECCWNERGTREKLAELMFEKYSVPAFYLAKNAVLVAFANGRSSALVLDCGASHSSAVPVHDGYVLTQAVVRSPLGGDFLTDRCHRLLVDEMGVELVPAYQVASKQAVRELQPPVWTRKPALPPVTDSWHNYMCRQLVQDFQTSVLQCVDDMSDQAAIMQLPNAHYEFPNGYHRDFGADRFRLAECLFEPSYIKGVADVSSMLGLTNLVQNAVNLCDVDVRGPLCAGVTLTGGGSLLQGLSERVARELVRRTPATMKFKLLAQAQSTVSERRFASWMGGSILGSLGTFQQMWVSRQEYDDFGVSVVEKKCP